MTINKPLLLAVCCFLIALCLQFKHSLPIENTGTGDLRNRVVGARLQKDGRSPYFFEYKVGDSMRYYDVNNMQQLSVSNITASPFFHTLLSPLADLPQRKISYIWFGLQYVFILLAGLFAYLLAKNNRQKIAVMAVVILFMLTEAWKVHIAMGQIYILIPMLAMIIYYCFTKPNTLSGAFVAGLASIVLVLLRPNTVIFFVPFLLLAGSYSRKYLLTYITPVLLLSVVYFSFESNRTYWQDYAKAIRENIKWHQDTPEDAQKAKAAIAPKYVNINYEGWDFAEIAKQEKAINLNLHTENGNVFVVYKLLTRHMLPVKYLNLLSLLSVVTLLAGFFLLRKKKGLLTLPNAAIFGYALYMVVDLFSPVHRHQYYGMQWLFPALIAVLVYKPANKWFYAVLALGLLLNIVNTDLMKMEHTVGEYLFLLAFLALSLTRNLAPGDNQAAVGLASR